MQAVYYLAMLIGVGWLAVWCILPKPYDGKGWWPLDWSPFDMRQDVDPSAVPAAGPSQTPGRTTGRQAASAMANSGTGTWAAGRRAQITTTETPAGAAADDLASPDVATVSPGQDALPAWRRRAQQAARRGSPR